MQRNLNLNLCYQLMITQDIFKMKLSSLYSLYKVKQLYRKLIKRKKERKKVKQLCNYFDKRSILYRLIDKNGPMNCFVVVKLLLHVASLFHFSNVELLRLYLN